MDVPASLNVFSNSALQKMGVTDLTQLQEVVPGLEVSGYGARLSIRGVGNNVPGVGADPSAAINFDGVYIPRQQLALFDLYDLQRIEVLKGPQGTLYGRNATGGAINILTRNPGQGSAAEGYVGAGSYNLINGQAIGSWGDERGGIRIGVDGARDTGYTHNLVPNSNHIDATEFGSIRLKAAYALTPAAQLAFTLQTLNNHGSAGLGLSNNPTTPNYASSFPEGYRDDPRHIRIDPASGRKVNGTIAALNLSFDLDQVTLRSITGAVDYRFSELADTDGSGVFIEHGDTHQRSRFYSQEFQLLSNNGKLFDWTVGAYFSRERATESSVLTDQDYPTPPPYEYSANDARIKGRSEAVFASSTWHVGSNVNVTGGARFTHETKSGSVDTRVLGMPSSGSTETSASSFTPKIDVDYKPMRDALLYASVGRGFKSGGINYPPVTTFAPEKITAYEVGAKQSISDGRFEWNAALFHYDYKDLQLRTIDFVPGPTAVVKNVAKAPITGLDLGGTVRPTRYFAVDLNYAYLNTKLQNFQRTATSPVLNTRLPQAPLHTLNVGLEANAPVGDYRASARLEYNFQSSVIFAALDDVQRERRGSIGLLNANVRLDVNKNWYVTIIGRNLTNRLYFADRFYYNGFSDLDTYGPPRQLQIRVGVAY